MNEEARLRQLRLSFSPDPALFGVVRDAAQIAARQATFSEADAFNLGHSVEQACRLVLEQQEGSGVEADIHLQLHVFADRIEALVEDVNLEALPVSSPDFFLLERGVDRLLQEKTTPPRGQLTLVKYRQSARGS
jgi:hypothetical protein